MGWATLPAPGVNVGPCEGACGHTDCAATRKMAKTPCPFCGAPIGYGRPFYNDREHGLCHAGCLWAWVEREQAERAKPMPADDAPLHVQHAWLCHGADENGEGGEPCPDGCDVAADPVRRKLYEGEG